MINIVVCIIHGACYTNERVIVQFRIHNVHVIIQMYLALVIEILIIIVVIVVQVVIVHVVNNSTADANVWGRKSCWSGGSWWNSQ